MSCAPLAGAIANNTCRGAGRRHPRGTRRQVIVVDASAMLEVLLRTAAAAAVERRLFDAGRRCTRRIFSMSRWLRRFLHERAEAKRIGLLEGEAVTAVDVEEIAGKSQPLADTARGPDWFVRQYGHGSQRATGCVVQLVESLERVENALVCVSEIQLVLAVILEKKRVGPGEEILIHIANGDVGSHGQRAAHEHGSAVAHETGDSRIQMGETPPTKPMPYPIPDCAGSTKPIAAGKPHKQEIQS